MMKGSSMDGDLEFSYSQTIVLVGRKGNGKSATGNSIIGTNIFRSERSSSAVTTTCEINSKKLEDGLKINVIDTPGIDINYGIIGSSVDTEFTEEIINMAGDGIHAFLVVMSIRSRFSQEEEAAISKLQSFFGSKIYDFMILVFTGGDQLEDDETLEDFLLDCPEKLKEILNKCENRCVLFDNKTKDQTKRSVQVEKLFSYVNMVSRKNGGKLYNNEMFTEWKKEAKEHEKQSELEISMLTDTMIAGQFTQIIEMTLQQRTLSLERQLAEEHAARLKAEEDAKATHKELDEEIRDIDEQIEMTTRRRKAPWKLSAIENVKCVIV